MNEWNKDQSLQSELANAIELTIRESLNERLNLENLRVNEQKLLEDALRRVSYFWNLFYKDLLIIKAKH